MLNNLMEDNDALISCPEGFEAPEFRWDTAKCSEYLKLDEECLRCTSKKGSGFKTVMGTERFAQGGKYYFEVFINKGELFKIGVARPEYESLLEAFCDSSMGWAIYNGETRHNSNSTGKQYGCKLKAGDTVGVALDMEEGSLSYYCNGECWGVAFKDEELRKGELVAAVSPISVNDVFTLRNLVKED